MTTITQNPSFIILFYQNSFLFFPFCRQNPISEDLEEMNSLQCQLNEDEFDFQNYLDRGGLMDNIVQDLRALYNTTAEFRN